LIKFRRILVLFFIVIAIAAIIGVADWALMKLGHPGHGSMPGNDTSTEKPYDEQAALKEAQTISPEMIGYKETSAFAVPFHEPRALAVDDADRIYVGGDRSVAILSPDGKKLSEIPLTAEPRCLAVGGPQHGAPGQLYVGMTEHVDVYDPKGEHVATWPSQGNEALFTSITTKDYEVWVADAGNRLVWRYDLSGKPLSPIGKSQGEQGGEFVVTSDHFALAAGRDGLIYIVNPRLLRIEGYTSGGDRETKWGQGSPAVADFFGCCNPAHLAVLPDSGDFITAEKGIPRVKVYSRIGEFKTVVAGPPQLTGTPAAVAGGHQGRVLVLDAQAARVRIFEKKTQEKKQ
jgi:hypothetical protein